MATEQESDPRMPRGWSIAALQDEASAPTHPRHGQTTLERWADSAWRLSALPLLLLFAIPILALLLRTSPALLLENLNKQQVVWAIGISLRTTTISLMVTILLGTPVAYLMGRRQFRFKRLVDTLIDLPTVMPPSVAGLALLITFGRKGLIGGALESLGLQIAFTQIAVIIAQVFISAPFFVRAASLGFAAVDNEIEQAAHLDGAGRWQVFRYLIVPLSWYPLISGSTMSWARALGEFGATMIFAGNLPGLTQTMPTAIYLGFEVDLEVALTLSVILLLISFVSIWIVKSFAGRQENR
jgi:molybdate transport system permease protein